MPKGPHGQRRPADVVSAAVMVGKIATGEIADNPSKVPGRAASGKKGAAARAVKLTDQQRSEIASAAASARWKKSKS